jgi:hypothetical protein
MYIGCMQVKKNENSFKLKAWLERNARVFNALSLPVPRVLDEVLREWSLWSSCRHGNARGVG